MAACYATPGVLPEPVRAMVLFGPARPKRGSGVDVDALDITPLELDAGVRDARPLERLALDRVQERCEGAPAPR